MNRREFLGAVSASLLATPRFAATKRLPTRKLGRTGIKVPILGFGSGSRFLMYQDDDEAIAALNQAIDLGITYIDTAHSYGNGKSEERVGRVMATRRVEDVFVGHGHFVDAGALMSVTPCCLRNAGFVRKKGR